MNKKRVFVDFHHAGLLRSLILLFEKRLGYELYRPIGREWYERGYWKVYDHPATVAQYLDVGGATPDGSRPLNDVRGVTDGVVFNCHDIDSDMTNRAITYDGFMSLDFDIVIASIPAHIELFKKLCNEHPNKPKLIFQIGNAWTIEASGAPNVMASAIVENVPNNINYISYHQEFPLNVFYPDFITPPRENTITSMINSFHTFPDYELFLRIETLMPSWRFFVHGGQGRDNPVHGDKQVANTIRSSMWIWHTKYGGDGYGHLVHNYPACGRPMIVKKEYYKNKLAEKLMIDGKTCITIDGLSDGEIVEKILEYSQWAKYSLLCENAYLNFKNVVDFSGEASKISNFIQNLI